MSYLLQGLRGKNVIVTGAAGGLGSCIARSFASSGSNLLLTDTLSKEKALDNISKSIKKNMVLNHKFYH
jgi:NAD(P)-dependent dehydrogenase (short-subunit alcohol dehydrogenase family)